MLAPSTAAEAHMTQPGSHADRLFLALSIGEGAGLTQATMMPPFLRVLARLGLPVKPLHDMSTPGLLAFLTVGLTSILVPIHWLALGLTAGMEHAGSAIRLFRAIEANGGIPLVVMLSSLLAAATAIIIRVQALSRDLPDWRSL